MFRTSFSTTNLYQKRVVDIPVIDTPENKFISLYPENVDQDNVIDIQWLELLAETEMSQSKEKKVKLVIWDLDNTLWDGVLIENDDVVVRKDIIQLIQKLEKKGIINSLCSKNDEAQARARLQELDLEKYFVFPRINWDPKSYNIKKIIEDMNIAADTVVFVDDSAFERAEVELALPEVTVLNEKEIIDYSESDRFDVPVTEDTQNRKYTYRMLEKQKKTLNNFLGISMSFWLSVRWR